MVDRVRSNSEVLDKKRPTPMVVQSWSKIDFLTHRGGGTSITQRNMTMNEYEIKRKQLIPYIQIYLSKNLRMNIVFIGIVDRLKNNKTITEKQFNSLIKFLERETPFLEMNRLQIRDYFSPLISSQITKENFNGNTLCEFFV